MDAKTTNDRQAPEQYKGSVKARNTARVSGTDFGFRPRRSPEDDSVNQSSGLVFHFNFQ